MQTLRLAALLARPTKLFVGHLARGLTAALLDGEPSHRGDAIARNPQGMMRFGQAQAKGADNTGGDNSGARVIFYVRSVQSQFFGTLILAIPVAFSSEALYKLAQTETEARKLVDCPVEFIQWRFEIR